jgi:hypothetical protein
MEPYDPIYFDLVKQEGKLSPELERLYQSLKAMTESKPEPYRHPFLNGETQE